MNVQFTTRNNGGESQIKKALMIVAILLASVSITAAQSTVKGVIVNKSNVKNAANIAAGPGSEANMGSVVVK